MVKILLFLAQEQTKQDHGPEDRSGSILDNRWWAGAKATRNGPRRLLATSPAHLFFRARALSPSAPNRSARSWALATTV